MVLFPPIFLFHGRELHSGRIKRSHFQIHAAIRADDDLTNFGSSIQIRFRLHIRGKLQ